MAILQVQGVRGLAWLLQSSQEGRLCLESRHQHPEHRSPERQTGTAGHHLAVRGMPTVRELQLGTDGPIQNGDLELWDHSARRKRKKQSQSTAGATGYSKAPKGPHSFFSSPSFKDGNGLPVSLSSILLLQKNPGNTGAKTSTSDNSPPATRFLAQRLLKL